MSSIFDDVQSGTSTTASNQAWVDHFSDTPILGDNYWWFNHTLGDYVADKGVGWPPYGIIVAPEGRNILVWYDASSRLQVIDLTHLPNGNEVAISVKKPDYFEDPKYVELWQETIKPLVPTVPDIKEMLYLALGIGVVFLVLPHFKKG